MEQLVEVLTRIANCLERIEEALLGCHQEALREEIKNTLTSLLSCERTHLEYK